MVYIKKLVLQHKLLFSLIFLYFLFIFFFMVLTWVMRSNFKKYPIEELVQHHFWSEIFYQNVTSSLFIISLGIITLGFLSIFVSLYNLYTFILAIDTAYKISESYAYSFFIIMGHGLIEIPAIATTLYISTISLRILINRIYQKPIFKIESIKSFTTMVFCVIFMFLVASILESYITPTLVKLTL
ncbi:stage II sporulation protein M [Oceanobacillus caeni]|uniref:stage II sporulation protein M n=1 Tax=Oceanobacillus caeni TaxID=405946 RepID=UPI00399D3BF3